MSLKDCLSKAGYSKDEISLLERRNNEFRNEGESVEDSFKRLIPILEEETLNDLRSIKEQVGITEEPAAQPTGEVQTNQRSEPGRLADEPLVLGEPQHTIRKGKDEVAFRQEQRSKKAGSKLFNQPIPEARALSDQYKEQKGLSTEDTGIITSLDKDHQKAIADEFESMEHRPDDPEVKEAYEAMAQETLDQYQLIKDAGVTFEIYEGEGEPYANSEEMIADVRDNKHMYILSTDKDFGETPITDQDRLENPLLRDSGEVDINGKPLLINDVFRGVHDYFGHTVRGNSFGPTGEENAWVEHVTMYSPKAARAMTTETRGQNSWVNFGPNMRNSEGKLLKRGDKGFLSARERPFADQKIGLMPEWTSRPPGVTTPQTEGRTFTDLANRLTEIDQAERSKAELAEDLSNGVFGLLTAENPNNQQLSNEENAALNAEAKAWLEDKGYTPVDIVGKYNNVEFSFYVPNMSMKDAQDFAVEFNQESVATDAGLVGSDGIIAPRDKSADNFDIKVDRTTDFFSVIKANDGNLSFTIGYDFGTEQAPTQESIQSQQFAIERQMSTEADRLADAVNSSVEEAGRELSGKESENFFRLVDSNKTILAIDEIFGDNVKSKAKRLANVVASSVRLPKSIKGRVEAKLGESIASFAKRIRGLDEQRLKLGKRSADIARQNRELKDVMDDVFGDTVSTDLANEVQTSLQAISPGLNITVHPDQNSYDQATDGVGAAEYDIDGNTIHINGAIANDKVLFHEAAHVVFTKLFADQPDKLVEWADGIAEVLEEGTGTERNLALDLREFITNYEQKNADAADLSLKQLQAEEFFAEMVGLMTANQTRITSRAKTGIVEAIRNILRKIFGSDAVVGDTLNDVIDLMNSIADGLQDGSLDNLVNSETAATAVRGSAKKPKSKSNRGPVKKSITTETIDRSQIKFTNADKLAGQTVSAFAADLAAVGKIGRSNFEMMGGPLYPMLQNSGLWASNGSMAGLVSGVHRSGGKALIVAQNKKAILNSHLGMSFVVNEAKQQNQDSAILKQLNDALNRLRKSPSPANKRLAASIIKRLPQNKFTSLAELLDLSNPYTGDTKMTFEERKFVSNELTKKTALINPLDRDSIIEAVTDPMFAEALPGDVVAVLTIDPKTMNVNSSVSTQGRLFNQSASQAHPSYTNVLEGDGTLEVMEQFVPIQEMLPEVIDAKGDTKLLTDIKTPVTSIIKGAGQRVGKVKKSLSSQIENKIKQIAARIPNVDPAKLSEMLKARGINVTPEQIRQILKPKQSGKTQTQKTQSGNVFQGGQGPQASKVTSQMSLKAINEVVRDIRGKLLIRTGQTANRLVGKTTVDAVIEEAVRDHITTDGSLSKERDIAAKVINGDKIPSASEELALAYALMRMKEAADIKNDVHEKAKQQNHPDVGKYHEDLVRTENIAAGYAKAIEIAGSKTGLALRIRQEILTFDRYSEAGITRRYNKAMPKGVTLNDADEKKIAEQAAKIHKQNKEIAELRSKLAEHGDAAKESIAESEVKNLSSSKGRSAGKKTASGKIKQSKNLKNARKQLDDVLKGKIC